MSVALTAVHAAADLVIVTEAVYKLELAYPCARGISARVRLLQVLKSLAWLLLAFGAGASLLLPLLGSAWAASPSQLLPLPTLENTAITVGFAVLIIRTRFKEESQT